jgi:lysophospholipase L1-like esterase
MFPDGTRWSAIGDSITHGGSYYAWVYLYYTTRFPQQELAVANCGISGDTANGAVRRYDWDIAPTAPTQATIMLGMNDVGRSLYGQDETPALAEDRAKRTSWYHDNMRQLVQKLKNEGVTVTLITPSPYDDTAQIDAQNLTGVNAALGEYGDYARQLAAEEDLAVIDFHDAMTALNEELQADDPGFTLIGPDRVHPRAPGHFVMAYLVLTAQGAPAEVSRVSIDASTLEAQTVRAQVSDVTTPRGGGLIFTCEEEALPFPIADEVAPALDYVPFTEELNQEILSVTGLPGGSYALSIDQKPVGTFTAEALAVGINLAILTDTPQYQQALRVLALVKQWRNEVATLRGLALIEHTQLKDMPQPVDFEQARPQLEEKLQQWKTTDADKPHAAYYASRIEDYLANKPKEPQIRNNVRALEAQIREAAQPHPHTYLLSPASAQ